MALSTPVSSSTNKTLGRVCSLSIGLPFENKFSRRIADLSTLWAEAQVYTSQLSQIDHNSRVFVQYPDLPGKQTSGKIEFTNPEINAQTRINLLRVSIPNPQILLKPGMPAYITIKGKQVNTLSLPSSAVLRTGAGVSVWVQTGDRSFKSKMVKIGLENGDRVQINSGLKPGDIVVISGAYLLNSEFLFKNGATPMDGMKM